MDDGIRPIDENGASELVFERVELGEERDLEERPLKSKVINAGVLVVAGTPGKTPALKPHGTADNGLPDNPNAKPQRLQKDRGFAS